VGIALGCEAFGRSLRATCSQLRPTKFRTRQPRSVAPKNCNCVECRPRRVLWMRLGSYRSSITLDFAGCDIVGQCDKISHLRKCRLFRRSFYYVCHKTINRQSTEFFPLIYFEPPLAIQYNAKIHLVDHTSRYRHGTSSCCSV
jgi:hypothetical protein